MQHLRNTHFNYSLPENFGLYTKKLKIIILFAEDFISSSYGHDKKSQAFWMADTLPFRSLTSNMQVFLSDNNTSMPSLDKKTLFQPYGTSLRMSDLGYTSSVQSNINISLNNLDDYIEDLTTAMKTPEPSYQNFGFKKKWKIPTTFFK